MKKLTTNWASSPDRENLSFEIWYNDGITSEEVAEISYEQSGSILIELMASLKAGLSWTLDFSEFRKIQTQVDFSYFEKVSK